MAINSQSIVASTKSNNHASHQAQKNLLNIKFWQYANQSILPKIKYIAVRKNKPYDII